MAKKLASILLCILFISVLLFGCVKPDNPPSQSTDSATTAGEALTTEGRLYPNLPDDTFNGYDYRLYVSDVFNYRTWEDLFVEESGSEPISEAVYYRNQMVEEKYKISLSMEVEQYLQYETNIVKNVGSNDDFADLFVSLGDDICRLYTQNVFYNLRSIPHLDFSMPWWDEKAADSFTLGGYMPFGISDLTVNDKGVTGIIYFNKKLTADLNLGDLYQLVKDDEWSFAKMVELGKKAILDVNEIGTADLEDRYGILGDDGMVYQFFAAGDAKYIVKDKDDMPEIAFNTEKNITMIQYYLEDILFDEQLTFNSSGSADGWASDTLFANDQGLFLMRPINTTEKLRATMESEFGILPLPKYSDDQKNYCSPVQCYGGSVISVPLNAEDTSRTGIILEALSAESRYTVIPAFYDIVLKNKNTRDEQSKEMLDIILDTRIYDVGVFYDFAHFPNDLIMVTGKQESYSGISQTSDIVSFYRQRENKLKNALEDLTETIEEWKTK